MFSKDLKLATEVLKKALGKEKELDLYTQAVDDNKSIAAAAKDLEMLSLYIDRSVDKKNPKPLDAIFFKAFEGFNQKIKKNITSAVSELEKIVNRESNAKGKSGAYRALKVFIAELEVIDSKLEQQRRFMLEQENVKALALSNEAKEIESKLRSVLTGLRQVGTNMEAGIAAAALFCKKVSATPTAQAWNEINSDQGARKLTQPLSNIVKFCYTDIKDIDKITGGNDGKLLLDPTMIEHINELKFFLKRHEAKIKELGVPDGKNAFEGNLAFLANRQEGNLPPNASEEDVRRAVKRFSGMLKEAAIIAKDLKSFGY